MHQRSVRPGGGDAFGAEMVKAFNNDYAKEQLKISYTIDKDEKLQEEIMDALGIAPDDKESFRKSIRTFEANGRKLQEIRELRSKLSRQLELSRSSTVGESDLTTAALQSFLESFSEEAIDEVENALHTIPSPDEIRTIRKNIRRYISMYKLWPELVENRLPDGS
jgi:hypothetical protein